MFSIDFGFDATFILKPPHIEDALVSNSSHKTFHLALLWSVFLFSSDLLFGLTIGTKFKENRNINLLWALGHLVKTIFWSLIPHTVFEIEPE